MVEITKGVVVTVRDTSKPKFRESHIIMEVYVVFPHIGNAYFGKP